MAFTVDRFRCPRCMEYHGPGGCSFDAARKAQVVEPPKPKRKLRIVHKTTMGNLGALYADIDIPEDFSLPTYVQAVRAAGYILNDIVYIPVDEIASMCVWAEDKPPPQLNVVPFDGSEK